MFWGHRSLWKSIESYEPSLRKMPKHIKFCTLILSTCGALLETYPWSLVLKVSDLAKTNEKQHKIVF